MAAGLNRIEESADAMGSTFTIILYGDNQGAMQEAIAAAFHELGRLERMLSSYRDDSELSRLNRDGAERAVPVSAEFFRLIARCIEYSRQSGGTFDISVGPLLRVWGFLKGTGRLPEPAELAAALPGVGYRHLHLDPRSRTVRFDTHGVEINAGGIGKGYAVDQVVALLKRRGFNTALVSGGGSSIYGLGSPPSEPKGWRIDIPRPRNPRQHAERVFLRNMSMSTSGDYEKCFLEGGRLYSHIMDPRTGFPAEGVELVSVVGPRTLDSEAWTKPCFILGRTWVAENRPPALRIFLSEDRPGGFRAWL